VLVLAGVPTHFMQSGSYEFSRYAKLLSSVGVAASIATPRCTVLYYGHGNKVELVRTVLYLKPHKA